MEDYRNMERCSGEPCCIFAERICADNEKEILKMEKDTKEKVTADEMMDDLIYLAELIDFMGITSCLAVRGREIHFTWSLTVPAIQKMYI